MFHEPLQAQNDENCSIKILQPYPIVAADALLEIRTAVISAVLSLDGHFVTDKNFFVSRNSVTIRYILALSVTSLSEHALLDATRTAVRDSDTK
jgi:hypothetical protein